MHQVIFKTQSGSPDSDEWHLWRSQGIGGSDAPIIAADAGMNKKASWMKGVHHLWLLKTGQIPPTDFSRNPAVQKGKQSEASARRAYEEQTGNLVSPMFGEMDENRFIRSSFDGVGFDRKLIVEIKYQGEKAHGLAKFGKIPEYYEPQVIHQGLTLWGSPEKWGDGEIHFVSHNPDIDDTVIVKISAKKFKSKAAELLQAEIKFWQRVVNKEIPCGEEWLAAAAKFIEADEQMKAVKKKHDDAKAQLITLLGTNNVMEGGGVLARRAKVQGRVDYTLVLRDLLSATKTEAEIEEYTNAFRGAESESITVKVTAKPAKTEKNAA